MSTGHYVQNKKQKPKTEYTFLSSSHRRFSRIDNILDHTTSLNKFKRIDIISNIFSDHSGMELEINYRKQNRKRTNTWRQNNKLQKKTVAQQWNQRINQKIPWDKWQRKHNLTKSMGCSKTVLRGKFIVIYRPSSSNKKNLK